MFSSHVCCLFIDPAKKPVSTVFHADVGKKVLDLKDNTLRIPEELAPVTSEYGDAGTGILFSVIQT